MLLTEQEIENIITFWFPNEDYHKFWFGKNETLDELINKEYNQLILKIFEMLKTNDCRDCSRKEMLCIIILLDQFSRNISRVNSIFNDDMIKEMTQLAKKFSLLWINNKYYITEPMNHTVFALMPLRHLNKIHDYKLILKILEEIPDKSNDTYKKFISNTERRYQLLSK